MRNKGYTTVDFVAFSIVGTLAVVAVSYVLFGWAAIGRFLADPATAAWVQAIGSIGAIVGAFFLATLQVSSARAQAIEIEHRRLIRRHNAISAIGAFAEKMVRKVCVAAQLFCDAEGEFVWRSDIEFLQLARDELETLRGTELESFHLVRGIRRLAVSVDVCIRMDGALVDGLADSSDYGFWRTEAANAAENAAGALHDIEQAITEFREDPEIALPPFFLK